MWGPGALVAAATLAVVSGIMLAEARLSARHERGLRARGAIEPSDDVYRIMQVAYPACFVLMAFDGAIGGVASRPMWLAGAALFAAAKALKYWAVVALGARWTFRVLVMPGEPLVTLGPYRYLRHPNYLAVTGELVAMAVMMAAPLSGAGAFLGFGALMARRIRVEERMLASASRGVWRV